MQLLRKNNIFLFNVIVFIVLFANYVEANTFVAYSMREAELRLKRTGSLSTEAMQIGGITQVAGLVYDSESDDLIVVGQINKGEKALFLDDFVVALRSRLKYDTWPAVSIEKNDKTDETGKQEVLFEGGIENTYFGKDLLEADIILKKMSFGHIPTDIWGIQSYVTMAVERAKRLSQERTISTRFWFYPMVVDAPVREGVIVINELSIGVRLQILGASEKGKQVTDISKVTNEAGAAFAKAVTANYKDLAAYYPAISRVKKLLDLVTIADRIKLLPAKPSLSFWLHDYKVAHIETLKDYPLLKQEEKISADEKAYIWELEGGVKLEVYLSRLNEEGDITALRDVVLKSKPRGNPLIWTVPLENWRVPGTSDVVMNEEIVYDKNQKDSNKLREVGMSLTERIFSVGTSDRIKASSINFNPPPLQGSVPNIKFTDKLSPQRYSPNVGGVMLSGAAKVAGSEAKVDLASGNFSLIVDGQNARLSPEAYRKFITALWSVYYSNQDPGISIDPIGCFYLDPNDPQRDEKFKKCLERHEKKEEKHLVRYIGKVINTDLGRVMREADYLMKKWSVGTERPDIRGFKNPDEYRGWKTPDISGSSRFWFVPEDMRFKKSESGDMLLFEDGRMTVKTEFMFRNERGKKADPDNEKFANFFTENYKKIAEKHPVYQELFDYAKMVSLAKYLKEQGIPLYWFLMANKDMVITEDSPGTVDALAKGSNYYKNLYMMGGVDLGFNVRHEGNYVYDEKAVMAINEAVSKLSANAYPRTNLSADKKTVSKSHEPFSFNLGKESYTVVPQHSLTSGKDRRGNRYQTDIALKGTGFQLTEDALRNVGYEIYRFEALKELAPIMESADKDKITISKTEAVYNRISRRAEEKAKEVMERLRALKNHKYTDEKEFITALEKTIGREQADKMGRMIKGHAYYNINLELVRYYKKGQLEKGEFGKGWRLLVPYRLKAEGDAKTKLLNVIISQKMAVENLLTGEKEILTFSPDRYSTAGYVPDKLESSQLVGLFIMTDASYRLADKLGNEFWFDQAGYLTDMIFSENHRVRFEYLNGFTDAFEKAPYNLQPADKERVNFFNASIPKRMKVADLVNGDSETLTFSDKGKIAGYVPEDSDKSRFRILALMSDASFRLVDKEENETAFSPSGDFIKMAVLTEHRLASAVSQGNQKIKFKYTIDKSGRVLIAGASLFSGEKDAEPSYFVKYHYDDDGRLFSVKGSDNKAAALNRSEDEQRPVIRKAEF